MDKSAKLFKKLAERGNLNMALSQLDKVKDYSSLLHNALHKRHAGGHILIPAWVASKITKAEDYLNSSYDYMSANTYKYANKNHLLFKGANMARVQQLMQKGMPKAQAMKMAYPKGGPSSGGIGTHASPPPMPIKLAEEENARRLKRGAGATLGIAAGIAAGTAVARPKYIKTKFRGDVPMLKGMREAGKKLKERIADEQTKANDYLRALAVAKHGPVDDPKVFKSLSDAGIIALASLKMRSAAKK